MRRTKKNLFGFGEKTKRAVLTRDQMRQIESEQRRAMEYDLSQRQSAKTQQRRIAQEERHAARREEQRQRQAEKEAQRRITQEQRRIAKQEEQRARQARPRPVRPYQGYAIRRTAEGFIVPKIDPETTFEDLAQAKRFIASWKNNPAKFERCVKKVKAKGGAANAYAVCTAAGTRKRNKKNNPADAAAATYEEFHGRPSEKTVVIKQTIHYHAHLAAIGELRKLRIVSRGGGMVTLTDFKGALLCQSENAASFTETGRSPQLYIEGGEQSVDLEEFWIENPHEFEALGDVVAVEYFTRKDHLGSEGGTAVYRHEFEEPYPELQYDVRNKHLSFSGGAYTIPAEGIDR